jgi:transposase InsO family protein
VLRYIARKRRDEAKLIREIHALAIRNGRYGYRRITVLLRREGWKVNRKRVHRIWKAEGLSLPLRRPRRRRIGPLGEIVNKAEYPNHVWSYDFLEDRTELPASVVVEVLEWLFLTRGVPKYIRSNNGPEFVAKAVCQWLGSCSCQTLFINPGSPWENGYIESFIDKLRDECLNREIFRNGKEAQAIVENWRQEYNNYRSHSSLDYQTPDEFARQYYEKNQVEARAALETAGILSL